MRAFLLSLMVVFGLSACQIVYKLPTRQGNVLDQRDLDKLKTGMTRDQVRYVMGVPVTANPFRDDRWDYLGYYKSPRGDVNTRLVSLYFDGDKLARLEGTQPVAGENALAFPDLPTIESQGKKAKTEDERAKEKAEPGVVVGP